MCIVFVGIDLAKNVFAVHGVNEAGEAELVRESVPRARLADLIAGLPPCTIGTEVCSGAHHWARQSQAHGLQHEAASMTACSSSSPHP